MVLWTDGVFPTDSFILCIILTQTWQTEQLSSTLILYRLSLTNQHKNGIFYYREGSTSVYRNNIYQFVNAGYLSLNYKPNDTWDILIGSRVENNVNITRFKELSQSFNSSFSNLTKNQYYILPSLSVKKELNRKSNLIFTTSKTITRPILIEYMPITYINPNNENILGNPKLQNSENYNIDLKYEIFPSKNEMFAIGFFGKRILNAIEKSYTASANSDGQTITFFNAKQADVAGIELEGIINLKRLSYYYLSQISILIII